MRRLLARILPPRSWCAGCGRPWFADRRRVCECGVTARVFTRSTSDAVALDDRVN